MKKATVKAQGWFLNAIATRIERDREYNQILVYNKDELICCCNSDCVEAVYITEWCGKDSDS